VVATVVMSDAVEPCVVPIIAASTARNRSRFMVLLLSKVNETAERCARPETGSL